MIIRIETSGGSFLGAGKYYLHDKLTVEKADAARSGERVGVIGQSDERVWFTDTRNTLNSDPERALDEMWRTAEDQAYLKLQAGVKRGGRVCEDAVKTISLSWHKDDTPTPEHMIESADAFLKHMGWDNHQAVYVGHSDTEHRHIHIILNRVNPENGRTIDDFRERKRAQSWALGYEKEQDNIRCEERELRAAKREQRAPELNDGKVAAPETGQEKPAPQPARTPANDHLPHNVVMLSRPREKEFAADEQARAALDEKERADLKAHQRAEREAFFKDGAKLFKATRHAVYDEVRKEYAPEWKQFYKDSEAAQRSANEASGNAVTRALHFAKDGRWEEARTAFADRDSVRDDVAHGLSERKADLKDGQTEDLRERQRDACDALRDIRDVQYQELLQRQRKERGALRAGETLQAIGHARGEDAPSKVLGDVIANENRTIEAAPAPAKGDEQGKGVEPRQVPGQTAEQPQSVPELAARVEHDDRAETAPVVGPLPEAPQVTHQISDLAAGAIGSVANYLADQLGELFAPTPPEVREAEAKAHAKREADAPEKDQPASPYDRLVAAAVRSIQEDRASGQDETYWKERDRGKGWERDQ